MGTACLRVEDRLAASLGQLVEAPIEFSCSQDVRFGGVLFALPALLANGLTRHLRSHYTLPKGFYGIVCIFILLAYLALTRQKSLENLRHCPPGELGKLLGLDRAPEVRTLREKLEVLSEKGKVQEWSTALSREWMAQDPTMAGYLYIDGHVRVYHGELTELPKRYVARERLCLPGTTDYWVNDALGRPFFSIPSPVDPGMLTVLREVIVPRLEAEIPQQPSAEELTTNPHLFRFALVFDRAGYSPAFFQEMWKKRIACFTYRKYQTEPWPDHEFLRHEVRFPSGETETMTLAERGVLLDQGWVREIRKQGTGGHQTALITTDFCSETPRIAAVMFSRWSQENFFKYMMEHFGINGLVEYDTEELPETTQVVNPRYRALSGKLKSLGGNLTRLKAQFAGLVLEAEWNTKAVETFERKKGALQEAIEALEQRQEALKAERKAQPRHVTLGDLAPDERFRALPPRKKQLVDTVKMIAYRAETALATMLKPGMAKDQEARALLREVFVSEANLIPDEVEGTLTVALHHLTHPVSNRLVQGLCEELNATETTYPGTNLTLKYKMVSKQYL